MTAPLPLLEPVVLNEVLSDIRPRADLQLVNSLPRKQILTSNYTWEIKRGKNTVGTFNTPNSEANVVDRPGRSSGQASLAYTREKKTFEPTTEMWIKAQGTVDGIQNAEQAIIEEMQDLRGRVDYLQELVCWKAITTGKLDIETEKTSVTVDYKFEPENFVHPAVSWATATPIQIVQDLEGWFQTVRRREGVNLTDAWLSQPTLSRIFYAFANAADAGGLLMTDAMRTSFLNGGQRELPGFMGVNWHVVEGQYDLGYDDDDGMEQFLPDDTIAFTALGDQRPMTILEGPTADFGNGQGAIGYFMKTWEQPDPSARWGLLESRWLPIIQRPNRILVVPDVTQTS